MKFEFHPEARLEFLDAVRYYESRQSGLGEHFISFYEKLSGNRLPA